MDGLVVALLLLSVTSVKECQCFDVRVGADDFDGNEGASGQVLTESAEVAGKNCTEASAEQEHFTHNEAASSEEKLPRFISFANLQNSEEGKGIVNPKKSPINNTDMIKKLGRNSDLLEQTSNQNVSSLLDFEGHFYTSSSDNDSNASDNDEVHVTQQHYTDDSEHANALTSDNNLSLFTEDSFEDVDRNFNRSLNYVLTRHHNNITAVNNSHVKEGRAVNVRDDNRTESHNEATNDSLIEPQLLNRQQSDAIVDEYISTGCHSEETFEQVFNVSEGGAAGNKARHCFGYQADSERLTGSGVEVPESNTESTSVDNEGNVPALDNVFEVHHYTRNLNSGDPHVGEHNNTLAERVEELVLNRLPHSPLRNHTANDDVGSGDPKRDEISLGVEISPDEIDESDDDYNDEINSGVSLAFVFDSTGSMWDDLVQVKIGAERIMATMLERPDKPIYNYVLVPFHDPKIGPITVTTDHSEFRKSLHNITVHGGGDCPEMAVGAVKEALSISLPHSFIYVFTDARAKDFNLINEVLALIQRKHSQVVFVMTGDCGDNKHIGYQVFEEIASTSSGQVYHINKTDVEEKEAVDW